MLVSRGLMKKAIAIATISEVGARNPILSIIWNELERQILGP